MRLYDRDGNELSLVAGCAVLEEYGTYSCSIDAEAEPGAELFFGERRLERREDGRYAILVGPWAGSFELQLRRGVSSSALPE